ncbi:hypothetical protein QN277_023648 [Acacia crassicarpa]|uniref:RING-type E3 ubiquitin transferase n=1 Tax=Acacia crassicarpa TaxID=499986 RepID=A0AAE1MN83_9FABA|nr:hypothetical protein QN277_023648 [Acacia crassicarpa]
MLSTASLPIALPDSAADSSPLLRYSVSDQVLRGTSGSLRRATQFFRRASGRRMMLREPSVRVRENAAEQLEARQSNWAFSKPVVILDVFWNLVFMISGIIVLGLSVEEKPSVPLRLWICGYLLQGVFHCVRVILKYRRYMQAQAQAQARSASEEQHQFGISWERGLDFNSSSGSDIGDSADERDQEGYSIRKRMESANTMFSFIWWLLGFYWITTGGQSLTQDAPQLYWLCITFLAIDIVIVLICVVVACLVSIAVCCCLPCILAFLSVVADKEGATVEEINRLPKYKFRSPDEFSADDDGDAQASCCKGIMTECGSDTPAEHALSKEDAECCICLCAYEDGAELRELPCGHHFHADCIDKWLIINANCPLCKFNVHTGNHSQV